MSNKENSNIDSSMDACNDVDLTNFIFELSTKHDIFWIEKKLEFCIKKDSNILDFEKVIYYLFKAHKLNLNKSAQISIQHAFLCLYKKDSEKCTSVFINFLNEAVMNIVTKTVSTYSIFILLKWTNYFIINVSIDTAFLKKYFQELVLNQSILLELYLSSAKNSTKSNVLRSVQKTLKNVLINSSDKNSFLNLSIYIKELIKVREGTNYIKNTVLLGIISSMIFRSQSNEKNAIIKKNKDEIIDYYVKNIMESRISLPKLVISGLNDFFTFFVTFEDFKSKILSNLEKAILRTPEIVLNGILEELLLSLSPGIDISEIIYERLFIPILNSLKSSNDSICKNALRTFKQIMKRCNDCNKAQLMIEKIISILDSGALFSLNHKLLHIEFLMYLPKSLKLSELVLSFLIHHIYKETNENISIAFIECFFSYFTYIIDMADKISDDYIELIKKGFTEKNGKIRRIWFNGFGNVIWSYRYNPNKQIIHIIKKMLVFLQEIYENILINPLKSIQDGTIVEGYVCTVIFINIIYNWKNKDIGINFEKITLEYLNVVDLLPLKELFEKYLLSFENTPHFVFWDKIYIKNLHKDDKIWFIRSLESITEYIQETQFKEIGFLWTQASFSLVLSNISHDHLIVSTTCNIIKCCYLKFQNLILDIFLSEIWKYIRQLEKSDISTNNSTSIINSIYYVINSFSPNDCDFLSKNYESIKEQLIKTIVLYHHPLLRNKLNWIVLCQKFKIDPRVLINNHSLELANTINSLFQRGIANENKSTLLAIRLSISTLISLDELIFVPLFLEMFLKYLSHLQLESISEKDIFIFKDEVNEKIKKINHKVESIKFNTKDMLQKNKLNKNNINKENQTLLDKCPENDAIKSKILNIKSHIISGLIIIQGLISATHKNKILWYYHAINTLLSTELLKKGSLIVGELVVETYLSCASYVSLKNVNTMIGVSILRMLNIDYIYSNFVEEPLNELIMRLLSQLTCLKQYSFDEISFIYLSPFLIQIIKGNGIKINDSDDYNKQITLALNILSSYIDFYKSFLSRVEVIQGLLNVLYHFPDHFNHAKNCLILLCKIIKDNITEREIMELMKNSVSPNFEIRNTILQAIEPLDLSKYSLFYELYLIAHDKYKTNATISLEIMKKNNFMITCNSRDILINYLCNDQCYIRECAAKAIFSYIKEYAHESEKVVLMLIELYKEKSKLPTSEYDDFGIVISESLNKKDLWEIRSSIALSLYYLVPYFTPILIPLFLKFLIGISNKYIPLNDSSLEVRQRMLESGLRVISYYGDVHFEEIFEILDNYLTSSDEFLENKENENIIILYGEIASHLKMNDQRIHISIGKLMNMLRTPSEDVQIAIAECFSLLIRFSLNKIPNYIERLEEELFTSEKYSERKGAAYGLAGVIKGGGIELIEKYEIMKTLKNAITNKKDQKYRQGSLFAIESFSRIIEKDFEPYIIEIVPYLLTTFGDSVVDVRESTVDTVKTIMNKISEDGVKLILPSLLSGLDDNNWRIKRGSIDFLSSIEYSSYQLSSFLPIIIPRLTEMINDSHFQVRLSGNESLLKFGKTINNPEIQKLVPTLLKALSNSNAYIESALDLLLKFSFVHYIDSTSLAIIMPVLEQGLKERSAVLRKKAIRIVEKISCFVEMNDIVPYLNNILFNLRKNLVDPVPETREISAKTLGILVKNLGEVNFPQLIPDLLSILKKDISSIDRHGSAQGISEILSGLSIQYLENILPEILENSINPISYIKEGYISLFIYFPQAFGSRFQPYIGKIISPILLGLADDSESVREVSLLAGKAIINNYAMKSVDFLLPELQKGIFNENWRIRLSSIQLVGDLLFHITGISKKPNIEDNINTTMSYKNILLNILGQEKRDYILASLYIIRHDSVEQIQSSALNIWKILVINTSKTIKEILPIIVNMIIYFPITSNNIQDSVFVKTLGELVKKLGEDVISCLLLPLQEVMNHNNSVAKVRISIALNEIIRCSNAEMLEPYKNGLIKTIQYGLMDSIEIRKVIAQMFNSLCELYGNTIINQILPDILDALDSNENSEDALEALNELIFVRSQNILPILIPKITKVPLSIINAKIINSFSKVSSSNFKYYLSAIINALMDTLIFDIDEEVRLQVKNSINSVLLSVHDFESINILIPIMLELAKNENKKKQILACQHMTYFFKFTNQDYSKYFEECIYTFVSLFDNEDEEIVKSAWEAQNAFTMALKKEDMENLIDPTQKILHNIGTIGNELKAFKLPKGVNAILPIFMQGLICGNIDKKELAIIGISDVIERADSNTLDPFIIQITGSLIRIIGEQYPVHLKLAILHTLSILLRKVPLLLKPFLPQLQRTFLKCLSDPISDQLRSKATFLLKSLISLQPRLELLVNELASGSRTSNNGVKYVMIKSLFNVVSNSNFTMNEMSKNIIYTLIEDNIDTNNFQILIYIGRFSAILFKYLDKNNALNFLYSKIFVTEHNNYSILTLNAILVDYPEYLIKLNCLLDVTHSIINGCLSNKPYIINNGILAAGKFLLNNHFNQDLEHIKLIIETLINCMKNPKTTTDASRLILTVISVTCKKCCYVIQPYFNIIIPIVFHNINHVLTPIQHAAESAYISLFGIASNGQTLFNEYVATLNPAQAKAITAYHKRIIAKTSITQKQQNNLAFYSNEDYLEITSMANLKYQKRLAAAVLKCGKRKVWIDPNEISEIGNANSRQNIRRLIKDGLIIRKPPTMHSHYRVRELHAAKRKGRHTGLGKRKGTANARFSTKIQWQFRQRILRRLLCRYRDDGKIDKYIYHRLYAKAKGNQFKHKRALAEAARSNIIQQQLEAKRMKAKALKERRLQRLAEKRNELLKTLDEKPN
ncbi:hypothetical protein PORY_001832 [Pneumocystis oryctolagi]|uniref:Uncharacterized protein n=1 Tax=Pneumocystis oryctolagi TaxID=42067 RepID=A0ACB7CAM8_9ASCO|nr:hypothetical protein PORY_001832 [Pneumocystis oryctolagi]